MAIEIKKTKGLANKEGISLLAYGYSGVGKSSLFRSTGKTLLISAELGELVLNDVDNVDVIRVGSFDDLKEAYTYAKGHVKDYDTVGIDSLTEIGEMIVTELKKDPEFASMKESYKMWMRYTDIIDKIAKSFRNLKGVNVVIIALAESVKNGFEEKIMPLIPAKKSQAKLASLYDEVFYVTIAEDGSRIFQTQPTGDIIAKDRSGKLEPTEPYTKNKGLQPIFEKILGKENK